MLTRCENKSDFIVIQKTVAGGFEYETTTELCEQHMLAIIHQMEGVVAVEPVQAGARRTCVAIKVEE